MPDPTTPAKNLTQPQVGGDNNTWGGLLNTDLALIDSALGGTVGISISGSVSLNSTQTQNTGYEFAGTLSGTATITWTVEFQGFAVIQNGTTGGHSIICGISGTTVTVLNGETVAVWSDGTNFYRLAQFGGGVGTTGTGSVVLATTPTIASPTLSGTVAGSGTIPNAVLQNSSITIAGHSVALGGTQTVAASDLTNGTTGSGDIVLAASPTLSGTIAGNLTWSGDQYFETGRPWADVRAWGAVGNGSTSDTTAFQNALNHMSTTYSGGIVFVPPGTYALPGGISVPTSVRMVGAGNNVTILTAAGTTTGPVVTLAGFWASIEHLCVLGCGSSASDPTPTYPAVLVNAPGDDNPRLVDCRIYYGLGNIKVEVQDTHIEQCSCGLSYGTSQLEIANNGQVWGYRNQFDAGYPEGVPAYQGSAVTVWSASLSVSVGEVVDVTGASWLIQYTQAGTTGSSAPTSFKYNQTVTDGTAQYQVVCPDTMALVLISTTTGSENYITKSDFSGAAVNAINVATGANNVVLSMAECVFSDQSGNAITLNSGNRIIFYNNEIDAGWASANGITAAPSFGGTLDIHDNIITANGQGIRLRSSTARYIVRGNVIGGAGGSAVSIDAGVLNFIIEGNQVGANPNMNSNANGITVATGASDHYVITNNIVNGVTGTGITDGGSGSNKNVSNNY